MSGCQTLWLNSGNLADPSICVSGKMIHGLAERFAIKGMNAFHGAQMLVFGNVQTSSHGKSYVLLENLDHITFDFSRDA